MTTEPKVTRPYPRSAPCAVNCRGDGDQIGALIGENIQEGVVGYGDDLPSALRSLADALEVEVGQTPVTTHREQAGEREVQMRKDVNEQGWRYERDLEGSTMGWIMCGNRRVADIRGDSAQAAIDAEFLAKSAQQHAEAGEREDVVTRDVNEQAKIIPESELEDLRQLNPPDDPRMFRRFLDHIDALNQQHADDLSINARKWIGQQNALLTAAASRHEAELVEARNSAAACMYGPTDDAGIHHEFGCAVFNGWRKLEGRNCNCLRSRILAILPADIRQRVADAQRERELKIVRMQSDINALRRGFVNLLHMMEGRECDPLIGIGMATSALDRLLKERAAHDLKVKQDFAERVVTLLTECDICDGRIFAAVRQLASERGKEGGD